MRAEEATKPLMAAPGRITSPEGRVYEVKPIESCQTLGAYPVLNDDGKVVAIAERPDFTRTICQKTAPGNG
jgi:hypothetical protein